jgi:hypothetical protein
MVKDYIVKALKWALSKFEDKPVGETWPFPAPKVKQTVKKTRALPSRATVAKKATTVAKKTIKKAK